jgi:uncharacterized protein (TIGR02596 family)
VVGEIDLARQTALSRSEEVELRFLPTPDESGNVDTYYRGVQIFKLSDGTPLDKIQRLPSPIVILDGSNASYCTLFAAAPGISGNPGSGTQTLPNGSTVTYRSIDFTAAGSTTLNPANYNSGADSWFLTVKSKNAPFVTATPSAPAKNFITIQIDPVTARTRTFQP